jgi:hypothetical protein
VAPKIRNFVWRACRNILPTQTKLFDMKISSSFSCHWCEEEPETGDHVLWQCEFAQRVWTACSVQLPWSVDMRMAFGDFSDVCLRDMQSPDVELIFTTAWILWCARNELIWEGKVSIIFDICSRASAMAIEFLEFDERAEVLPHVDAGRILLSWSPPSAGCYKVAIACNFTSRSDKVGVGVLIRDSSSFVVAASGFVMLGSNDFLTSYAYAVFYAMQLAHETGFRCNIDMEVPSQELLSLLKFDSPCLAPSGVLVDDIGAWLPFFRNVSFTFISNVCNKATQALATEAASSDLDCIWLEKCLPCIRPFV